MAAGAALQPSGSPRPGPRSPVCSPPVGEHTVSTSRMCYVENAPGEAWACLCNSVRTCTPDVFDLRVVPFNAGMAWTWYLSWRSPSWQGTHPLQRLGRRCSLPAGRACCHPCLAAHSVKTYSTAGSIQPLVWKHQLPAPQLQAMRWRWRRAAFVPSGSEHTAHTWQSRWLHRCHQ